jgi:hypothetical protein
LALRREAAFRSGRERKIQFQFPLQIRSRRDRIHAPVARRIENKQGQFEVEIENEFAVLP